MTARIRRRLSQSTVRLPAAGAGPVSLTVSRVTSQRARLCTVSVSARRSHESESTVTVTVTVTAAALSQWTPLSETVRVRQSRVAESGGSESKLET